MSYMIRTTRGQYLRPMYSTATSGDVKQTYWTIVGILTLTVEELGGGPESEAPEENAR